MRKQKQVSNLLRYSASFVIFDKTLNTEETNYFHPQTFKYDELDSPINYEIIVTTIKVEVLFSFTFRFIRIYKYFFFFIFYVTMKTKTFKSSLDFSNWSYNKTRQHFETRTDNIMLSSCVD